MQVASTEAAALCRFADDGTDDECDDGCNCADDDDSCTCTLMDKLWGVIDQSDECRAFKEGMQELQKGKQNQASCLCPETLSSIWPS